MIFLFLSECRKLLACLSRYHYFVYLSLMFASASLSFAKFALFANSLDPAEYGKYSLVLSSYVFILYLGSLGANECMLKLGGFAYGRGEFDEITNVRNITLFYGFASTFLTGVLLLFFFSLFCGPDVVELVLMSVLLALSAILFNIVDSFYRSWQRILVFSTMLFFKSVILISCGFVLVDKFGIYGIVSAEIASFLIVFIYMFASNSFKYSWPKLVNFKKDINSIKDNGLAFLTSMLVRTCSLMLDRFVISITLGFSAVGKYSFVMILFQLASIVSGLITNVVGPKWLACYSTNGDVEHLLCSIHRLSRFVFVAGACLFLPFYFTTPCLMQIFFPQYFDSQFMYVSAMIYVGVIAYVCSNFYDWLFIATSNESVLTKMYSLGLFFSVVFLFVLYVLGGSLLYFSSLFLAIRLFILFMYYYSVKRVLLFGSDVS